MLILKEKLKQAFITGTKYVIMLAGNTVNYGDSMKKRHILRILVLLFVLAAVLIYDSNTRPVITEYEISSPEVPGNFDGFTVVQLSDLHGVSLGKDNSPIIEMTAEAKPDVIAITGDMVDSAEDLVPMDALVAELVKIAPVYYVSGNHEWGAGGEDEMEAIARVLSEIIPDFDPNATFNRGVRSIDAVEAILAAHGAVYLSNSFELLEKDGESIVLAGVDDPNGPFDMIKPNELVDIINSERDAPYTILLGHRNYWVEKYPDLEVDIILCGHAHGGIVRLPVLGGVLGTGFEFFPEHVDGAVESGSYTMIVSRGIGNSIPVPRFLNNPEIVVLKLKSE